MIEDADLRHLANWLDREYGGTRPRAEYDRVKDLILSMLVDYPDMVNRPWGEVLALAERREG